MGGSMWQQAPDGRVRHAFEPIVIAATLALIPVLVIESDVKSEGWQTFANVANWVIWGIFLAELGFILIVAPRKGAALRAHCRSHTSGKSGEPSGPKAHSSPSSVAKIGSAVSSGTRLVMSQPRRLRTRNLPSVETRARNPSHLTSYAQSPRVGSLPLRASMG